MKKTNYLFVLTVVLAAMILSACGGAPAPAATQPAAAPQQNQPAPTAESQPVQPQQPAPTAQSFAPACASNTNSCAAPAVTDTDVTNTYCVEKHPYQNISLPPGTTYEVLDTSGEFKCADSGTVVDGKTVISCTGKQLWTYELKLTNTSCGATNLATGTGQCQDGYGFDSAQNCCAPVNSSPASTTIKVNIGACPS
jgi:hypothetical protein